MMPDFPSLEKTEKIQFFFEDIDFDLNRPQEIIQWVINVIQKEKFNLSSLNFIFCSDNYLHEINLKHLNHDTYTDVITFPYSKESIEGDIFISVDRIKENAKNFKVSLEDEFCRVMIHGVLHLCGYDDKTQEEKNLMRKKEDTHLMSREKSFGF